MTVPTRSSTVATRRSSLAHSAPEKVRASDAFEHYCEELTLRYASLTHDRLVRWLPLAFAVVGFALAFTLIYVQPTWFFFGPSFTVAGLGVLLALNGLDGLDPLRRRTIAWVKAWPAWESVVVSVALLVLFVLAIVYQFWAPIFLGAMTGATLSAVYTLAISLPAQERTEVIVVEFGRLVDRLRSHGLNDLVIQEGLPKLMGRSWANLFERYFGYEAYRSILQQLGGSASSINGRNRRVRNFLCDRLADNAHLRRGPMLATGHLRNEVVHWRLGQPSASPSRVCPAGASLPSNPKNATSVISSSRDDDDWLDAVGNGELAVNELRPQSVQLSDRLDSTSGATGVHAHLHAGSIQINSLHTEKLAINLTAQQLLELANLGQFSGAAATTSAGNRKEKYDQMLRDAWSANTRRRKRFPQLQKWLGEEARISMAFLMLGLFGWFLIQSGLFSTSTRSQIADHWKEVATNPVDNAVGAISKTYASIAALPPTLGSSPICGWALGLAAIMLGISGLREGWAYAMFALTATLLVIVGLSLALLMNSSAGGWSAVVIAIGLMILGIYIDGRLVDEVIARWTPSSSRPNQRS